MSKPELNWDQLSGLALVAKQIDQLPQNTPEQAAQKMALKEKYQNAHSQLLEHYDMPVPVESPDTAMLHAVDYGSGLLRTATGETGLAAKAAWDKAMGNPSTWTPQGVKGRITQALNPIDRPALTNKEYLDMAGVGDMGHLSDIEGRFPVTGKEALGFGLDTIENPAMLLGLRQMLKGGEAAAERPAVTASALRDAEEKAKKAAGAASSPGFIESMRGVPSAAASWMADPLSNLRDALLKARFKNADNAVQLSASGGRNLQRPLPSKIFQDSGAKGITSSQIRQDARSIVNANSEKIQGLTNDVADAGNFSITRGTPDMANNPQLLDPKSAMYPLYTPEQQALERTPFLGKQAQGARAEIEAEYRAAAAADPGIQRQLEEQAAQAGSQNYGPNGETLHSRQEFLPGMVPKPPTTVSIPGLMKTEDGFIKTERPITLNSPDQVSVAPRISMDPLSVDEQIGLPKISKMAGAAQQKAATRKFYLQRDRFAADAPQTPPASREALAAEGGLYADQGAHLRTLQEDLMDDAKPGLGGDVHRINKDTSSLLEGMPYIDRPKPTPSAGTPTARSRSAFGGVPMMAYDFGMGAGKTAAMTGYQALSNPWFRKGALPAARSTWLQNYFSRRGTPTTNEDGMPGGENPWALIYKYGAQ